ncbi:MAG: PorP/SprF family type IX secretion system membrane protein [Cryomorphaceae bacterium]|jgi:type IX secretion system PorP/SprF family membrane protein|nr:PorP/SprF family type IX secretion system membrane protein [Cryomorphaceae bacterium]
MKNFLLSIFILVCCMELNAQDVHFSHAEFSPLTLNPGLAGALSPFQGIVNYRSQWRSVASPYKTIAASFDARFNEKKRDRKGIIAGGLNFFNDQAGDLKVVSNNVHLNLAYHLILNRNSTLGLGITTGYGQRSINPNAGRWGSQYVNGSFDATAIPNLDFLNTSSFSFLDAGTGMVYTYSKNAGYMTQNNQLSVNAGVAAYHLNKPTYSFTGNSSEKLYVRYSAFVNATIGIQNTRGSFLPGIYYQRQATQQEFLFGTHYKYLLNEGSSYTGFTRPMALYIGLFNRFRDALVGKIMFEYDCYSAGFAYDINLSGLRAVSNAKGGFELFLRYNFSDGGGFRSRI